MYKITIVGLSMFLLGFGCSTEPPQKKAETVKPPKTIKKSTINGSPLPPKGLKRPIYKKEVSE